MFRFPPGARFDAYESWRCLSAIFWWMAYAVHAEREGVERSLVQGPEQVCIQRAMVLSRMHCAMPFWLLELQSLQVGARGVRGAFMGCTLSTAD